MTIKYQEQEYVGFKSFIESTNKAGLRGVDSAPLYAHPVDKWILGTLNAAPIKAVMNKAMGPIVSVQFGHVLAQGISIDRSSFPELFGILNHCAQTLGIPIPHAVTNNDGVLFNAYTAGTDEYAFINISSGLTQFFTKEEACFVIGHECGHIASGHMIFHTLASVLTESMLGALGLAVQLVRMAAGVPLAAWSRRSEITADRAGLLCCGDLHIAETALLRLTAGFADIARIDINDYMRRSRETEEFHKLSSFHEIFASHPMIPRRIEALRLFANSELYYSLSRKPRPTGSGLLTREQLNQSVDRIVKP
jgi:Zn-dependent protease with chaperone function